MLVSDRPVFELVLDSRRTMLRDFARAAADLEPTYTPTWHEANGAFAIFAGDGSPLTQAAGLTPENLDSIGRFFQGRAKAWEALASTLDPPELAAALIDRGARPIQTENVYVRSLADAPVQAEGAEIDEVSGDDVDGLATWNHVSRAAFFGDTQDEAILFLDRLMAARTGARRYLAIVDGRPAAAASLVVYGRVAYLGGMATVEEFRGRGLQASMIARRLADASPSADLAIVEAVAGSTSARNSERAGFRLAFAWWNWSVPAG